MNFSTKDLKQLEALEIEASKAARQLAWLRSGQLDIKLERCCTVDDGITQLQPESHAYLYKAFDSAVAAGRLRRFVPASGAASRMFSPLHAESGVFDACRAVEPPTEASQAELDLRRFLDNLDKFAFYPDLQQRHVGRRPGFAASPG